MSRKTPTINTIKALLAKCGNQCAFPECNHPIINENNKLISQLCHIEAANKGGERFNPQQNDEDRRHYDNLLFLCYRHHIETNDFKKFNVKKLKEIKSIHESKFIQSDFKKLNSILLKTIQKDINEFSLKLESIHLYKNTAPDDIKMKINFNSNINDLIFDLRDQISFLNKTLSRLENSNSKLNTDFKSTVSKLDFLGIVSKRINKMKYYNNPFFNRNWEEFCLDVPNIKTKINILLNQIELKNIEHQIIKTPSDKILKSRFEILRNELAYQAKHSIYHD